MSSVIFLNVLILFFSYVFNFVWESWHGVFLYENHNIPAEEYVFMMNFVSMMDALVILGIYAGMSFFVKDFLWPKNLNKVNSTNFFIAGLLVSAIIEYVLVFKIKLWTYNKYMPTVFGIGLSPLIQLSTTGILSIIVSQRIFFRRRN